MPVKFFNATTTALLACLLAACVSTPRGKQASNVYSPPRGAAPGNPSSAAGAPDCSAAQLELQRAGNDAGMGHRAFAFRYTNTSSTACMLGGYPQVQALDGDGTLVPDINVTHVTHAYLVQDNVAQMQKLVPDASLWFVLTWSVIPHGNMPCPGMASLRIAPPRSALVAPLASQAKAPAEGSSTLTPSRDTTTAGGVDSGFGPRGEVLPQLSNVCDGLRVLPLRSAPPPS